MDEAVDGAFLLTRLGQLVDREGKECSPACGQCAGEKQKEEYDNEGKNGVRQQDTGGCHGQREGRGIV